MIEALYLSAGGPDSSVCDTRQLVRKFIKRSQIDTDVIAE